MLLKDQAMNEMMIDTEILAKKTAMVDLSEAYNDAKFARDILINVGIHRTFGHHLKTQILKTVRKV